MELTVRPISAETPELQSVRELYEEAFPENERAPFKILLRKSKRRNVDFLAYFDGSLLVGMTYAVRMGDLCYLFYLAVPEALRNGGYGSEILQKLKLLCPGHRIFLAMEEFREDAPNYDMRIRRLGFYERNGFHLIGQKVQEGPEIFELAGTDRVGGDEYKRLMHRYLGIMRLIVTIKVL